MSKNTPVSVGNHFDDFIERQVEAGRYESPSDVVRAGLRLLEEQELKIERLREALIEGSRKLLEKETLTSDELPKLKTVPEKKADTQDNIQASA